MTLERESAVSQNPRSSSGRKVRLKLIHIDSNFDEYTEVPKIHKYKYKYTEVPQIHKYKYKCTEAPLFREKSPVEADSRLTQTIEAAVLAD